MSTMEFHRLLKRQLKKAEFEWEGFPKTEGFINAINQAYQNFNQDIQQLEHTLELNSKELFVANQKLRAQVKDTTDKAREATLKLETAAANVNEVIFWTNRDGEWTYLNAAWENLTGKKVKDSLGSNYTEILLHPDGPIVEKLKDVARGRIENVSCELEIKHVSGETRWIDLFVAAHKGDDNLVAGIFGTLYDITKKREFEAELISAKEIAEHASAAKANFLSTMSHEIRTPMNAVINIAYLLLQNEPRQDQLENLNALKFSGDTLLALINDILDFNKIESGKIEFESRDYSLRRLVKGVRSSLRFQAEEKGVTLKTKIDDELPEFIVGDPTRMTQILVNLIGNSIKFTNVGSVLLDLEVIDINSEKVRIRFSVKDTGIGIAPEQLDKIFEDFTQASAGINRKFGGTGLGLSICKRLLELQDSDLKVESRLGKGTTFFFELEMNKSNRLNLEQESGFVNAQPSFGSLKGLRILMVEDNSMNVMVTRSFMKKWDVEIEVAGNGEEALDMIVSKEFHLVLMDLQMPIMDGYTAAMEIRKMDDLYYKQIPIIALTASAIVEVANKVKECGMNDFLPKPFHPSDLYSKIKHFYNEFKNMELQEID